LRKRKWRREQFDLPLLAAQPAGRGTPEDLAIERDLRTAAAEALGELRQKDIETLKAVLEGQRPRGSETARAAFRKRVQRAIERVRLPWRNKHGTD
jgi:hypothetical protein